MRSEQNLNIYSFENVAFHVLSKRRVHFDDSCSSYSQIKSRVPRYSPKTLTEWYRSSVPGHASRVLRYFSDRTTMVLDILEEAQVVTKTA